RLGVEQQERGSMLFAEAVLAEASQLLDIGVKGAGDTFIHLERGHEPSSSSTFSIARAPSRSRLDAGLSQRDATAYARAAFAWHAEAERSGRDDHDGAR